MRISIFALILFTLMNLCRGGGNVPPEIVGEWDNGRVSMLQERNTTTGVTSPGNSSYFSYNFTSNGKFNFTGIMEMNNYGCKQTIYNEKSGSISVKDSAITLIPSKNLWRNSNSCSSSKDSEKNQPLTEESYKFSLKKNEYGQELICLANNNGESCYRRKK